jgi:RND family efflux transporter MFP subunit
MQIIPRFAALARFALTTLACLAAVLVGWRLWTYYMDEPWTRDGRVRADVVRIAPDVSGPVVEVRVRDNQEVHRGDLLFRIDRVRFDLAVRQAQAVLAARRAVWEEAALERDRYRQLSSASVSREKQEQTEARTREAEADVRQAEADLAVTQVNLARTEVLAPADGTVTNLALRPGDYATAGQPAAALVDAATLHVDGYFEETKLRHIREGDAATVRLMGEPVLLHGHVESVAGGIEDRERAAGTTLLANVNPTFSWVRLAQRVPVRIVLDDVPDGLRLVPGRTATVAVLPRADDR